MNCWIPKFIGRSLQAWLVPNWGPFMLKWMDLKRLGNSGKTFMPRGGDKGGVEVQNAPLRLDDRVTWWWQGIGLEWDEWQENRVTRFRLNRQGSHWLSWQGWQGIGCVDKGDKGRVENAPPRDEWADNFGRKTFPHRGHRAQLSPKLKLTFSISNTVAKSQKKLQSAAKLIFGDAFALD